MTFYKDEVHIAFASIITYRSIYNYFSDFGTPFKSRKNIICWNVNKLLKKNGITYTVVIQRDELRSIYKPAVGDSPPASIFWWNL